MTRALALARFVLYAAFGIGAATAPNVARTFALLAPVRPVAGPPLADAAAASLGWLATFGANAFAHVRGYGGLTFATALALVATLMLVEWRARRAATPVAALAATILAAGCLLDSVHVGDGVANGLMFAALLAAFDVEGYAGLGAAAAVTVLWCNLSPAGVLAPGFALAFALGTLVDRAPAPERTRAGALVLATLVALLATPAAFHFPAVAWRALALDGSVADAVPHAPAEFAPLAYRAGLIAVILAALAFGARAARSGPTLVFALATFLAFADGAFVPFAGIAAAPILAEAVTRILARGERTPRDLAAFARVAGASGLAVALGAGLVAGVRAPQVSAAGVEPFAALARFAARSDARDGVLLCTHLQWCDVAERGYGLPVFADTKLASATDARVAAQIQISGAKHAWRALAHRERVTAIFASTRSGFATILLADRWRPVAVDGTGTIFVNDTAR